MIYSTAHLEYTHVMNLPRKIRAVRLLTADSIYSVKKALHIFAKLDDIYTPGVKMFALLSKDDTPLVLIVVKNNAVVFCRAAYGQRPKSYAGLVVEFIVKQDLDVAADMGGAGIVRQKGTYYNIYDLPKNFVYSGNMDLSNAGFIRVPAMTSVVIRGDYNVSGNQLISLYGAPKQVTGNFYAINNRYPQYTRHKPSNTIIGGHYYNTQSQPHR